MRSASEGRPALSQGVVAEQGFLRRRRGIGAGAAGRPAAVIGAGAGIGGQEVVAALVAEGQQEFSVAQAWLEQLVLQQQALVRALMTTTTRLFPTHHVQLAGRIFQ